MSNAQYEPQDVLDRLGVKLLRASPNDRGWEVFSLDYKVDPPLQPVIHAEVSLLPLAALGPAQLPSAALSRLQLPSAALSCPRLPSVAFSCPQ